jgi:hypothetical protein
VHPSIYNPSFFLPTTATLNRRIEEEMEQVNFDIGEEFHNYVLAKEERPYHGVIVPDQICEAEALSEPLILWTAPPFGWSS